MLGAHALATLATSAVLAGAEDAVFTVAAALAGRCRWPPRYAVPEQPGGHRGHRAAGLRLRGRWATPLPASGPPREHAVAR